MNGCLLTTRLSRHAFKGTRYPCCSSVLTSAQACQGASLPGLDTASFVTSAITDIGILPSYNHHQESPERLLIWRGDWRGHTIFSTRPITRLTGRQPRHRGASIKADVEASPDAYVCFFHTFGANSWRAWSFGDSIDARSPQ